MSEHLKYVFASQSGLMRKINSAIASMTNASVSRETVYRELLNLTIYPDGETIPQLTLVDGTDVSHIEPEIKAITNYIRLKFPDLHLMRMVYHHESAGSVCFLVTHYENKKGAINPKYV